MSQADILGNFAIVIAGDFNAHDRLWQASTHGDPIGKEIAQALLANNFIVANDPHLLTYVVKNAHISPDLTITHGPITIFNWTLEEPFANNHHHVLSYNVQVLFALPGIPKFGSVSS